MRGFEKILLAGARGLPLIVRMHLEKMQRVRVDQRPLPLVKMRFVKDQL